MCKRYTQLGCFDTYPEPSLLRPNLPTHVDNMMTASATDRRSKMSSAHFHLEVAAVGGVSTKMSLISRCSSPEALFDWLSHFLFMETMVEGHNS